MKKIIAYKTNTGSPIMLNKANLTGLPDSPYFDPGNYASPGTSANSTGGFWSGLTNVLGGLSSVTGTAGKAYNDLSGIFGWTKNEGSPILIGGAGVPPADTKKTSYTPLIIGGIVAAILITVLLIVIFRKKK
ncbi:MAG: hypothetical protein ACOYOV_17285 [Bacteroidales bacterium]